MTTEGHRKERHGMLCSRFLEAGPSGRLWWEFEASVARLRARQNGPLAESTATEPQAHDVHEVGDPWY